MLLEALALQRKTPCPAPKYVRNELTLLCSRKGNPPEYTTNITLQAIPKGTFVKDGNWQYTFVCSGCLKEEAKSFKKDSTEAAFGYALSSNAPSQKANKGSPLNYHMAGSGSIKATLTAARSDKFHAWSKLTT
jgi:cellobiose dehydrogenase (acceptor)